MTTVFTQKLHSFDKHNAHFDKFLTTIAPHFDNKVTQAALCVSLQKNAGDARSA